MALTLADLGTEILIHIFQFCNINDLCRLKQTCVRFNNVIDYYFDVISRPALVTNQKHLCIQERSAILLTSTAKWQISHNWKIGRYKEKAYLYDRMNYIPWLNLEKDVIWISRGPYIKAYKRLNNNKIDVRHHLHILSGNNLSDISRFTKQENCLVSGQSDGALWVWTKQGNKITTTTEKHQKEVVSVDIHNNVIVSGSRDCTFKLWNCKDNFTEINPIHTSYVADRLWSTSFNENGLTLAVGTSGCNDRAALKIFDVHSLLEIYSLGGEFQKGAGILDMKWDSDKVLLACGYDSCVRRWDLRTGKCVQCWEDPFYATIYCLDIDKMCTLIVGTQNNGRVVLFDTRQTKYSQMYFMQTCKMRGRNSPAYSLSFDATQLFVATDQHLNVLDFTDKRAKIRNYSNLNIRK